MIYFEQQKAARLRAAVARAFDAMQAARGHKAQSRATRAWLHAIERESRHLAAVEARAARTA